MQELSSSVHHKLRSIAHGSTGTGTNVAALVPQATKRIHRLLVEGSVNEESEFDPDARALAYEALESGAKSLFREAKMESEGSRVLRGGQNAVDFDESHTIGVQVVNDIGIEVTKTTTATVGNQKPTVSEMFLHYGLSWMSISHQER